MLHLFSTTPQCLPLANLGGLSSHPKPSVVPPISFACASSPTAGQSRFMPKDESGGSGRCLERLVLAGLAFQFSLFFEKPWLGMSFIFCWFILFHLKGKSYLVGFSKVLERPATNHVQKLQQQFPCKAVVISQTTSQQRLNIRENV